jgi:hypothetical protein
MTKQAKTKKPIGRPPGSNYGQAIPVRLAVETVPMLDDWAEENDVSRSEAIRRLVEIGLKKGKR